MNKLISYLTSAKGLGLKLLFLFAVVSAVIFAINLRVSGANLIPYAQSVADQILPVKIVGGVIVEPVDTIRKATINVDGAELELPLILDTNVSTLDTADLKDGIYITQSAVYMVNNSQVRINKLQGDIDLPQGDYTSEFKSMLNWAAVIAVFAASIGLFATFFILGLFYAACSYALTFFMKKPFSFDLRMRASAVCLLTTYVLLFALGLLGIVSGKLGFFLVVMLFEYFLLRKIPAPATEA